MSGIIKTKLPFRKKKRRIALGLAFILGILLFTVGPGKVVFNQDVLLDYLQKYSCCTIYIYLVTYVILTVIGVPGTVLTIAGGLIFGLWWGTVWSVIGATIGALGAFWVARYLLHELVKNRFGKHQALVKFNQAVIDKPLAFVLAIRFAPISPFNVVNFLFGLTPIHWLPYTMATLVGIIPGTLAYTWLGVTGSEAWQGGDILPFCLALGFLAILSFMPIFFRKGK